MCFCTYHLHWVNLLYYVLTSTDVVRQTGFSVSSRVRMVCIEKRRAESSNCQLSLKVPPPPRKSSGTKTATTASYGHCSSHARHLGRRRRLSSSHGKGAGPQVCTGYFASPDLRTTVSGCAAQHER